MSTLTVTTINTANGITDLTLGTGNTSAPKVTISSSTGELLSNSAIVLSNNFIVGNTATGGERFRFVEASADMYIQAGNGTSEDGGKIRFTKWFSTNSAFIVDTGNNRVSVVNTAPVTNFQIQGNYGISATTLSAGNNHNINCASGNYFVVTCNSSVQNVYFTSVPANTVYSMTLRFANGNGGNTISWANTPKWPGATAPQPSTNTDIWVFITDDAGVNWRGNLVQRDSR